MSVGWMTALMVIICLTNICSNIVYLAAVTRDLFAFLRKKGLPFSKWLSTVHSTRQIPVNAAKFTCVTDFALALIYIGSEYASPLDLQMKTACSHLYSRSCSILRHYGTLHNRTTAMLLPVNQLRLAFRSARCPADPTRKQDYMLKKRRVGSPCTERCDTTSVNAQDPCNNIHRLV
jgi:hypothetical protein